MKIIQVEFSDWRVFRGNQKISFSTDHVKPVTTIYGTNGSGKTTILNALLWTLWGDLTEDFEFPDQLINKSSLARVEIGTNASAYVQVKFLHGESNFTMKKICTAIHDGDAQTSNLDTTTSLIELKSNGETFRRNDDYAISFIDQILPKQLAKYFFFNGERFGQSMNSRDGQKGFGQAVRHVLGLTKYERADKHVTDTLEKLLKEIGILSKNDDLNDLLEKRSHVESEIRKYQTAKSEADSDLDICRNRREEINKKLENFQVIREQIKTRNELEAKEAYIQPRLDEKEKAKKNLIAQDYALLVLSTHAGKISEPTESHREKKHIPAGFKKSFIDDLINAGECICGCQLIEGSESYNNVFSRLKEGGLTDTEEEWTILASYIAATPNLRQKFVEDYKNFSESISRDLDEIIKLREESALISEEISKLNPLDNAKEVIAEFELERRAVDQTIEELARRSEKFKHHLEIQQENFGEIERKINAITPKNEAARTAGKQRDYLVRAQNRITEELMKLKRDLREDLELSITTIFRSLSNTNYFASLDDEFQLKMCERTSNRDVVEVGLGNGDRQLSFYAFIAALSKMNFERSLAGSTGIQSFPIMIDAPFSNLDGPAIKRVAEILPKVTHQPIFAMLKEHINQLLAPDVQNKVGAVAIAKLHKPDLVGPNVSIDLPQGPFVYISKPVGEDRQFTELVQVV